MKRIAPERTSAIPPSTYTGKGSLTGLSIVPTPLTIRTVACIFSTSIGTNDVVVKMNIADVTSIIPRGSGFRMLPI